MQLRRVEISTVFSKEKKILANTKKPLIRLRLTELLWKIVSVVHYKRKSNVSFENGNFMA